MDYIISSGQTSTGKILVDNLMRISSGGIANSTTVITGEMWVSSGGTASSTTVYSGGGVEVLNGGTANSTTVNSGGYMEVHSGGSAAALTVNLGAHLSIAEGGSATEIVENGGSVYGGYDEKAVTFATNIIDGLLLEKVATTIHSGTTANSINVNSGGSLEIYSGGTAHEITENGGYVFVEDGADVTFVPNTFSGGVHNATVRSGTTANSVTVNSGGHMRIFSGGLANNTMVNGWFYISSGGVANSTTVNSSGRFYISNGGTANSAKVNSGGWMSVYSGTANSTTVNSGGRLYVISGGVATDIIESGGYVEFENGATVTFLSNSFSGLVLSYTSATVHSGTTANTTIVNAGGTMYVSSGGLANDTMVNGGGTMYVSSGGTATVAFTPWQGSIVSSNGASITYLERDANVYCRLGLSVSKADIMDSILLSSGCSIIIYSGGLVNSTTVNRDGNLYISSGGVANNTTFSGGGILKVSSSGVANGTAINGAGILEISSGGTLNSTTINSWGHLSVSSGVTANDTTVYSGGSIDVLNGGTANSTTVNSGGSMWVSSGGTALNLDIANGAYLSFILEPNTHIQGSSNGSAFEMKDGLLSDYTVHKALWVSSGGTANNITVAEGGDIYVLNGGKLTGKMTFESGAEVSAEAGAILDFDLTQASAGAAALVNDLSCVVANPVYTLTVNGTESSGTYSLADGVSVFNSVLSVMNTSGEQLGSLMVGQKLETEYADYSLKVADGSLTVTIKASKTQTPDIPAEEIDNGRLYDKKKGLNPDAGNFVSTTLEDGIPGIPIDQKGSFSFFREEDGVTYGNHVGKDDEADFAKIKLNDSAKLSFVIEATDAAKFSIYSLTPGKTEGTYTLKTLQTTALKKTVKDGVTRYTTTTKSLLFDKSGTNGREYYISVQSTNAKKGGSAYYNVALNEDAEKTFFYSDADDGTNGWLSRNKGKERNDDVAVVPGTAIVSGTTFVQVDEEETVSRDVVVGKDTLTNYVGYGDAADYRKITLETGASLSFTVKATDAAKIVIYSLAEGTGKKAGTYTMKQLQTTTLKLDKATRLYTIDTKPLLLSLNAEDAEGNAYGEYYVSVQSTNAAKGGKAYYSVELNDKKTVFYSDADDGMNNWLYRKADKARNMDIVKSEGTAITMGTTNIQIDEEGAVSYTDETDGITYSNFVGFGDDTDFARIELEADATVSFKVDATDSVKFMIYSLAPGRNGYTMKAVQTTTLKLGKDKKPVSKKTKAIWLAEGTYYIAMQSTNAKSGGAAYYNVSLNIDACSGLPDAILEGHDACALTMPESFDTVDDLGIGLMNETDQLLRLSGMGASANTAAEHIFEESGKGILASL